MDWAEAFRLTTILAGDPSSQVCAALAGWTYPLDWSGIALRDLYDLQHSSKSKKKRPTAVPATVGPRTQHIRQGHRAVDRGIPRHSRPKHGQLGGDGWLK